MPSLCIRIIAEISSRFHFICHENIIFLLKLATIHMSLNHNFSECVLPMNDLDLIAVCCIISHACSHVVQERVEKMKGRGYDMICKVKGAFSLEILKLPMVGS